MNHKKIVLTIAVVTLEDIDKYKAMCTGAMCTSDDGTVTIYELADKNPSDYNFGASYQILKQEGLVTEEAGESFTASGNGITVTLPGNSVKTGHLSNTRFWREAMSCTRRITTMPAKLSARCAGVHPLYHTGNNRRRRRDRAAGTLAEEKTMPKTPILLSSRRNGRFRHISEVWQALLNLCFVQSCVDGT